VPVRGRSGGSGDANGLHGPTTTQDRSTPRGGSGLSEAQRAAIVAAVLELPPMADEQVDGVCEVIVAARARWRREDERRGRPPGPGHAIS
jgi:hypothetical protein